MRVLAKRMNVALLEMVDQFCFRDVEGLRKTTRRQAGLWRFRRSLEIQPEGNCEGAVGWADT